jgi:hypothetical protein
MAHRTLIVANRTAATPQLIDELERRARERPTAFALLIPEVNSRKHPDWTPEVAVERLARAVHGPVEGLTGGLEQALAEGGFDDVIVSTRRDLGRRLERLGVPVTVIAPPAEDPLGGTVISTGLISGA